MSFSPGNTTKTAENNLGGLSNLAQNQVFPQMTAAGNDALKTGEGNVNSGTNFLNTLLAGNRANTTTALQPNIDQIRSGVDNAIHAVSTLTPRGGGRTSSLFGESFEPQKQMQNLFNSTRTTAATALPQIGLAQQGIGTNLFGLGNQGLSIGSGVNTNLAQLGQQDTQASRAMASALGGGLFKLATTPFGGGSAMNGLLGKL